MNDDEYVDLDMEFYTSRWAPEDHTIIIDEDCISEETIQKYVDVGYTLKKVPHLGSNYMALIPTKDMEKWLSVVYEEIAMEMSEEAAKQGKLN